MPTSRANLRQSAGILYFIQEYTSMLDEISPAAAAAASTPESAPQPVSVTPEQTPPVSAPESTPTAASEPDIESLLKNPDLRQRLLSHPEVEREFQRHRSEGGRRAKAEFDAYKQQVEQWYRDQESKRIASLEDDEAGQLYKQTLTQQQAEQERQTLQARVAAEAGQQAALQFVKLMGERAEKYLDPEERVGLDWMKFQDPGAYIDALLEALPKKEAHKLAKEWAKKEAEAIVQERLAADRESAPVVPTTPTGGATPSASDFFKEFAGGGNNDTQRAKTLLKELGLSL